MVHREVSTAIRYSDIRLWWGSARKCYWNLRKCPYRGREGSQKRCWWQKRRLYLKSKKTEEKVETPRQGFVLNLPKVHIGIDAHWNLLPLHLLHIAELSKWSGIFDEWAETAHIEIVATPVFDAYGEVDGVF